eukprot:jgi/Tetstr1/457609/TSEL_044176.t1
MVNWRGLAGRCGASWPPPRGLGPKPTSGKDGRSTRRLRVGGAQLAQVSRCLALGGVVPTSGPPGVGPSKQPDTRQFGNEVRRVTDSLLALNVGVFVANWAMGGDKLLAMGAKVNSAILAGQWWRLLTCATLHGGLIHLLVNCYSTHQIGPMLENISGHGRFATVYTVSALTGSLASFALSANPSVGASGAIFGLGGALAVFFYRHKELLGRRSDYVLQQLGTTLAMNLMFGLMMHNIDNWGHIGGLLGGAASAYLLGPRLVVERPVGTQRKRIVDRPLLPLFGRQ